MKEKYIKRYKKIFDIISYKKIYEKKNEKEKYIKRIYKKICLNLSRS